MIERLFEERLSRYGPANVVEQEHALVELIQQYILAGLSRAGLFRQAFFHGGTCLRIIHDTRRFSEDLDFMLKTPDAGFRWRGYLDEVCAMGEKEGLEFELRDRSELDETVKKGFVKTDSIGTIMHLELRFRRDVRKKIQVKLEIDTNPPEGSGYETAYLNFPFLAPITTQTLGSGFGTKSHALLCRDYVKGRDWYDFLWYIDRGVAPDLDLLQNAIEQQGPWVGKGQPVTARWYLEALAEKIGSVDWSMAREDVVRFLPDAEQQGLELWSRELFLFNLERLARIVQTG